jgi:DNA polymerase III delta prime subunit|tara:strand:- start:156 stop:1097 length:942 start_codon:yes stop_codon:yes gene_type:complete
MSESLLWVEKYRPRTIEDCILPESIKKTLRDVVSQNKIPNMMFTGTSGIGKTTAARAICNETQADYLIINGSDEGRMIDTLRTKLTQFCSTISLSGSRKVVIIDEADYMNADSVQPAMRNFTERFADNCSFIFTCNYKNRIIEPIHSRCAVIDFSLKNGEKQVIAARFMKRVEGILTDESIDYDKEVIAKLVLKHFPDFRRVLNELQRYSTSGEINSGVLANIKEMNLKELIDSLREKNFSKMRQWVVANVDNDPATVYRKIYDELYNVVDKGSIPQAVLTIAEYQYKSAFVADQEINLVACLVELMAECEFV